MSWANVFHNADRISSFGFDPDGAGMRSRCEKPELSAMAVAFERLLPGDELVTFEHGSVIVARLDDAHPLAVTRGANMTWKKNLTATRKRKIRGDRSYHREVSRLFTVGAHVTVHNNDLCEITYQDGHKAFLVGLGLTGDPIYRDENLNTKE